MNVKSLRCLFVLAVSAAAALTSAASRAELQTVPYVDVNRYIGDWYQIAHIPLFFEGGNCACARQRLGLSDTPGVVTVFNSCNTDNAQGQPRTIKGTASDDDRNTNARFTVTFEGVGFKGSYWIIGLDPQYRFAVVSDKNQYSLYILSKTRTLPENLYKEALALAAKQLDTSKLVLTDQVGCTYP